MNGLKLLQPATRPIVKGGLEFNGFLVGRIRTKFTWDHDLRAFEYDVEILGLYSQRAEECTPDEIVKFARASFASNVDVREVKYAGGVWHLKLYTWSEEGHEPEADNDSPF